MINSSRTLKALASVSFIWVSKNRKQEKSQKKIPLQKKGVASSLLNYILKLGYILCHVQSKPLGLRSKSRTKPFPDMLCKAPLLFSWRVLKHVAYAQDSGWRVIILGSLRWDWLPLRFFIPIHIIVYVTWTVIQHTTPYSNISLHTVSKFLFPCLPYQFRKNMKSKNWMNIGEEENILTTCLVCKAEEGILHWRELNNFDIFEWGEYGLQL